MGSIIKQVAVSESKIRLFDNGYIKHAYKASKKCIKKANVNLDSVQLLINTGIYREESIVEPSVASLIHSKLQSKFDCTTTRKKSDFFSFDLSNGGVGTLQAIQVADIYIRSGKIKSGMIVAGDTEPIPGNSDNYNYSKGASSIILVSNDENDTGFRHFKTYYDYNNKSDYSATSKFQENKLSLKIVEEKTYLDNCIQLALKSIDLFLKDNCLKLNDIDLIIASQAPLNFNEALKKELNLGEKIICNYNGGMHTAGILFNLHKAIRSKRFQVSKNILFLSVGAGIAVSLALYTNSENQYHE